MMPGFYHRLQLELRNLINKPAYVQQLGVKTFKFHKAPAKENYTAWLGGRIYKEWVWFVIAVRECLTVTFINEYVLHLVFHYRKVSIYSEFWIIIWIKILLIGLLLFIYNQFLKCTRMNEIREKIEGKKLKQLEMYQEKHSYDIKTLNPPFHNQPYQNIKPCSHNQSYQNIEPCSHNPPQDESPTSKQSGKYKLLDYWATGNANSESVHVKYFVEEVMLRYILSVSQHFCKEKKKQLFEIKKI